ncbi:MAG: ubiquinol-cytochrome C chaperone family protein [Hyphomonas sp.]
MVFSVGFFRQRAALAAAASEGAARVTREALRPVYYQDYGVPDTFEGRSRLVTVMTALACARIARIGGPDAARLADRLNARILDSFDAAFREKGVGDASIARKVRKLAEGHSGIGRALMGPLAGGADGPDAEALTDVMLRNGVCKPGHEAQLVSHLMALHRALAGQPDAEILAGLFACGRTD